MLGWIAAVLAVVFAMFLWSRGRTYRRLFADDHFIEIARALDGIKAAAFARVILSESDLPSSPNDPRASS